MSPRVSKTVLLAGVLLAGASRAEDFPGGETTVDEFEKGFKEERGLSNADRLAADRDAMKIGGTLWSELIFSKLDPSVSGVGNYFSNPNSLWLYTDARLKSDVRGVVKLKTIYDPTINPSAPSLLSGQLGQAVGQKTQTDLEELKLLFTAKKSVFFTLGKQKLKWGSGKFWNPTDVMNTTQRNFLYSADLRSGIPLLKTHVPIGASNFYLVQGFDNANQVKSIRHAVRAEVPIGTGELAVTAATQTGQGPVFGADISKAVGDFDVYGEVAAATGTSADPSWVAGLTYEAKFLDTDSITFTAEYFRNGAGQTSTNALAAIGLAGAYVPFRLSREYGMFMLYLPKPGSWNQVTLSLIQLMNLTDKSLMSRVDALLTFMDDLSFNVAAGVHYGDGNGELKLGGQKFDLSGRLMIDF